jgi:REP-associated tyrosine transposase
MVLASHVIFGAYGFWLPNDPRGSWSDFVGAWELFRYGKATKTTETVSLAYQTHDHAKRLAAKEALKYSAVRFTGPQARTIGIGFGKYAKHSGLVIHACAIMPDHVHLVVARHRLDVEQLVIQLKGAATEQLVCQNIHPIGQVKDDKGRTPKCFARGEWKVFLDCEEDIFRAIGYVEDNPIKEGLPRQEWTFVTPYEAAALRFGNPPRRG